MEVGHVTWPMLDQALRVSAEQGTLVHAGQTQLRLCNFASLLQRTLTSETVCLSFNSNTPTVKGCK